MTNKIAVLIHEQDHGFETSKYSMRLIVEAWREFGFTVEILKGTKRFVPADVIVPHLDMTVIPDEYCAFMDQYPLAVNKRVVDVSKSRVSANKVVKGDSYAGPVIVKTERNYGGWPERSAQKETLSIDSFAKRVMRKLATYMAGKPQPQWDSIEWMESGDYPVFSSLQEVPAEVFSNPQLMVEKFLPEIDGDDYCLRYYSFFGHKERAVRVKSKEKVVKGSNTYAREEIEVCPHLRELRRRLGFDFGRFDYVQHNGKPVLFDTNRTPTFRAVDRGRIQARNLSEGIFSILGLSPTHFAANHEAARR